MTHEEIEKGVDELARRCAETRDLEVKGKLEHLSHRPAELLYPKPFRLSPLETFLTSRGKIVHLQWNPGVELPDQPTSS